MAEWLPSNMYLANLDISTEQDLIQKIRNSTAFFARMVKNDQDKE